MVRNTLSTPACAQPEAVLGALIAVQILFGANYVASKVVVDAFPPIVWASIRIIIAAVVMVVVALLSKRPHPRAGIKFFGGLIVPALLGTVVNQSCFLVGLHYTTSTNSAILNTLIPIFTLLIVTVFAMEPPTVRRVVGFVSGLAGVLILRRFEEFTLSNDTFVGDLLIILNCLSYALFLAFCKPFFEKYDRLWATAWLFVYGSVGVSLLALPGWLTFTMPDMTSSLWLCAAYAVVGGTILTYFLNNWALAYSKSSHVAMFIYVQPVITAVLAWAMLGEQITVRMILSSLLIFAGVLLGTSPIPGAGTPGRRG